MPVPEAITVRERHSFVQLPPAGFQAARFRSARRLFRHRLHGLRDADRRTDHEALSSRGIVCKRKIRRARVSEAVEPIVYYVDRGAPEPVRSALLEGARWWNQAFEAIGYKDAFRVEVMPPDMSIRWTCVTT